MNRFVCIHAHFYQPARENPWLEEIEVQDSAHPYHDWNERITAECYAPNAASRIIDADRRIIDIVNNYSRISFNIGPTLFMWLQKHNPETYAAILEADKKSIELFRGHGSAIAQVYNHMIMPLASSRDKRTQVIWGISDFKHRFRRNPEGMWLAETAVDVETLDILAEYGIRFTILAPSQAKRIHKLDEEEWFDVSGGKIDPKRAYLCKLSSGRSIVIFFYDGHLSQEIAFGGILNNGENFANKLAALFSGDNNEGQLAHIATDGETYGHHQPFGDMALAYCLYRLESESLARVTNYGEYLMSHEPLYEVEIFENSSWSCFHGVERWRSNCGCNSGARKDWNQEWRGPFRGAMDWLRDNLNQIFEDKMSQLVKYPWQARDEYIEVILNRSKDNVAAFLNRHAMKQLDNGFESSILQLLEMQKFAMFMYTSCGWFFDEVTGIESVQVMQYASRAMQLAAQVSGIVLEEAYIKLLEYASSNIPEFKNAAVAYQRFVQPMALDLLRVGVHYAVSSIFNDYTKEMGLYVFEFNAYAYERLESGKQKLAIGHVLLRSRITWEQEEVSFAALHFVDHNVFCGARSYRGQELFFQMGREIKGYFLKGEISEIIRLIDKNFSNHSFSLWHLFRDEQRRIVKQIFDSAYHDMEDCYRKIYDQHYAVVNAVQNLGFALPRYFSLGMAFVINTDLQHIIEAEGFNAAQLKKLIDESKRWIADLDKETLSMLASRKINAAMSILERENENLELMKEIGDFIHQLSVLGLELNLSKAQNIYFVLGKQLTKQKKGQERLRQNISVWLEQFNKLGDCLNVKVNSYASSASNV